MAKRQQDRGEKRKLLGKCATSALSSKMISQQKTFCAKTVANALLLLSD
jgi:T-complex protein 1 subunit eta